jgi:hypothetical protein
VGCDGGCFGIGDDDDELCVGEKRDDDTPTKGAAISRANTPSC